jgi:hypothetical protein
VYTLWVSNPLLVANKQGTNHVCIDLCDLNQAYLKENYLTPFIHQIFDACVSNEILSFMNGFSRYNQIQIQPQYQYKIAFITPWVTLAYNAIPFRLKNARATF